MTTPTKYADRIAELKQSHRDAPEVYGDTVTVAIQRRHQFDAMAALASELAEKLRRTESFVENIQKQCRTLDAENRSARECWAGEMKAHAETKRELERERGRREAAEQKLTLFAADCAASAAFGKEEHKPVLEWAEGHARAVLAVLESNSTCDMRGCEEVVAEPGMLCDEHAEGVAGVFADLAEHLAPSSPPEPPGQAKPVAEGRCPTCGGRGETLDHCESRWSRCIDCAGTGRVRKTPDPDGEVG